MAGFRLDAGTAKVQAGRDWTGSAGLRRRRSPAAPQKPAEHPWGEDTMPSLRPLKSILCATVAAAALLGTTGLAQGQHLRVAVPTIPP